MKTYAIEIMTNNDYSEYMSGSWNYTVITEWYTGETKEVAIAKAKAEYNDTEYHLNLKTISEVNESDTERKARYDEKIRQAVKDIANAKRALVKAQMRLEIIRKNGYNRSFENNT